MKNSKKGFTLTEVLIVTAIIVVLGGAAIAGIAVSIKNAQDRGNDLKNSQGENWESEAVLEVKKTKVGLGNEQIYEASADTPAPTNAASSDNTEITSTPTDAPDPNPKGDPDPEPKTDPDPEPVVNTPSGGGTNAAGSSVSLVQNDNNSWHSSLSFGSGITTATIHTDSSYFNVNEGTGYKVKDLGNGSYQIYWYADGWGKAKESNLAFNVANDTTYVTVDSYN